MSNPAMPAGALVQRAIEIRQDEAAIEIAGSPFHLTGRGGYEPGFMVSPSSVGVTNGAIVAIRWCSRLLKRADTASYSASVEGYIQFERASREGFQAHSKCQRIRKRLRIRR